MREVNYYEATNVVKFSFKGYNNTISLYSLIDDSKNLQDEVRRICKSAGVEIDLDTYYVKFKTEPKLEMYIEICPMSANVTMTKEDIPSIIKAAAKRNFKPTEAAARKIA